MTDIAITKNAPSTWVIGQPISYTLTVTNLDAMTPASGVVVTDTLPTGVSFVSGAWTKTPSGAGTCTSASQTVTCSIGTLRRGRVGLHHDHRDDRCRSIALPLRATPFGPGPLRSQRRSREISYVK